MYPVQQQASYDSVSDNLLILHQNHQNRQSAIAILDLFTRNLQKQLQKFLEGIIYRAKLSVSSTTTGFI